MFVVLREAMEVEQQFSELYHILLDFERNGSLFAPRGRKDYIMQRPAGQLLLAARLLLTLTSDKRLPAALSLWAPLNAFGHVGRGKGSIIGRDLITE